MPPAPSPCPDGPLPLSPALARPLAGLGALGWRRAALLLMAVTTVIMLVVAPDFGITWDEPLHVKNGRLALDWYASLGRDQGVLTFYNLYLYGALYDVVCAGLAAISPFDLYTTRRLVGGLVALFGVWGCRSLAMVVARHTGRDPERAGFLAAACLLLIPDWWGHACNNPKDAPFAVAAVWTLRWLAQVAATLPRPHPRALLGLGVSLGAALGIRVGGAILLAPMAAVGVAWTLSQLAAVRDRSGATRVGREAGGAALRLLPPLLLAYVIMVAFWPWAQRAPLAHPLDALRQFSRFPLDFTFPYAGRTMRTLDEPWWYLPVGFGVKLPESLLLLLVAAAGAGLAALARALAGGLRRPLPWNGPVVTLAAGIIVPPVVVVAAHSILYDGIRHMFFLMPPMAAAAALALDGILALLGRRLPRALPLTALALVGLAGAQTATIVRLHPYETIWFNSLTGGVAGAAGNFELDYWGSAMSETARALVAAVEARQGPAALTTPYRVRFCGPATSALPYLPPAWQQARLTGAPADFYLAFTRRLCPDLPPGDDMVRVEREGQTLAFVRDLRAPAARRADAASGP